ncbi:MAG: hypothetical protein Q8P58_01640 [Candidatus Adlerbacteria bacterium]|nr:hypothetical protein [Candidatus Adlerbacteria bacterium]MDZ4226260.1 hypothetical protein [Patescibacteria group bacterium]
MDPQIDELKELVRQNTAISQETNKMVRALHRASVWGRVFRVVWIGLIIAVSIGAFVYLGPYIEQVMALYDSAQQALEQARQLGSQFQQP